MSSWLYSRQAEIRVLVVMCALFAGALQATRALADGEAGLVVQTGDQVETYCVGFTGDSISGSELLQKVGIPVTEWSGMVCAVGTAEGCFQPGSFETCACQSYPPESMYWSFFVQRYGKSWQYSSFGFRDPRANLKDGDMQAWRWGKGSPNSAPAPPAITFERVCGHAPQGGQQAPTPTPPPAVVETIAPPTARAAISPTVSAPLASPSAGGAASATAEQVTAAPSLTAENTALITITDHGTATAVPQAPAAGSKPDGGSSSGLIAFAFVAVVLAGGIAGALLWRRRHGV